MEEVYSRCVVHINLSPGIAFQEKHCFSTKDIMAGKTGVARAYLSWTVSAIQRQTDRQTDSDMNSPSHTQTSGKVTFCKHHHSTSI